MCRDHGQALAGHRRWRTPLSASAEADAALSRQGRYQVIARNLQVKEVRRPTPTSSSSATTPRLPGEIIPGSDKLTVTKRAELRGKISTMPGLNRFLRITPAGCCALTRPRLRRT